MSYVYQNFYEMLNESCKKNPKGVIIYGEGYKTTYSQLKFSIDRVAAYLQSIGVKFGDKVAMIVSNSEEFLISYFAISAIGAVAVPINTFLKHEEFEYILNDCGAKILFASSNLSKEIKGLESRTNLEKIIWIGEFGKYNESNISFIAALSCKIELDLIKQPVLTDLAHIIYTSGTTGKPKGAMLSYKNVFSNIIGATKCFDINKKDRFIVFLPMFHSFTLTVMVLLPVFTASSLVLIKSVFPFSNVLKQALLKRVTVFLGVPAIYTAIGKAKIPWYFKWFNCVRLFISGAAPLAEQTIIDFKKKFPRAKLLEGYGLSECSPAVAINPSNKQKIASVGLPLPGYEIKIVNDEMMEVATGEVGEIIVKGDCVMQGYLNMPDATDETIMNGWLRTGDLGKVDEEGYLFIVDRKKDLIISKGINIYPREIEEVLFKLEAIEAAAVVGIRDAHADEEVIAFIQFKDEMSIDEKSIRAHLKKHLANFKIPKHIHVVKELPKNATGKVLKRVLKDQIAKGELSAISS
ncbi:fatty acid--CoA ligase [Campylobacter sp. RM16190]|uniref:fatty acid--CoA ligase n=1 Tax=Campylobacter sp. RM16190 TaxID=1705727 RepID=UPI0014746E54|nr:fatty acid--CoA ligase [Campylobacter sp. RM16190]